MANVFDPSLGPRRPNPEGDAERFVLTHHYDSARKPPFVVSLPAISAGVGKALWNKLHYSGGTIEALDKKTGKTAIFRQTMFEITDADVKRALGLLPPKKSAKGRVEDYRKGINPRRRNIAIAGGLPAAAEVFADGVIGGLAYGVATEGMRYTLRRKGEERRCNPASPTPDQLAKAYSSGYSRGRDDRASGYNPDRLRESLWTEWGTPPRGHRDLVDAAHQGYKDGWGAEDEILRRYGNPGMAPLLLVGNKPRRRAAPGRGFFDHAADTLAGAGGMVLGNPGLADAAEHWAASRGMSIPVRGSAAWQGMYAAWQRGGMRRNPRRQNSPTAALLLVGNPVTHRRRNYAKAGGPAPTSADNIKLPGKRDLGTITLAEAIRRKIPGVREAAARFKKFHGCEPPNELVGYDDGNDVAGFLIGQVPEVTYSNVPAGSNKSGSEWFHTISKKTPTYLVHVPYDETMHLIGDMPTNGVRDWLTEKGERHS